MSPQVLTSVAAKVDPDRETDLLAGYRQLSAGPRPDGLLRSELLRGQDGVWQIQTTWRDLDSLRAVRMAGGRPAAIELLDSIGAEHSHSWFVIEESFQA